MKKLLKIYLQKPELAGIVLLAALIALFQFRSEMVFLSAENVRGILGVLPEVGLVAIGVTLLMICGEFDLSVGSVFARWAAGDRAMLDVRDWAEGKFVARFPTIFAVARATVAFKPQSC